MISKEIIMKVNIKFDKGGYVSARIKDYDKVFQMSMTENIISEQEQARLIFKAVMTEIFDQLVLGIIKEKKK